MNDQPQETSMIDQELLRDSCESYLKSLIADVSGTLRPDFDSFAPFGELGIDSFHVLKIVKRLEGDFGTLSKSLLFEKFNINDLAGYFVTSHEQTLTARLADKLQGLHASCSIKDRQPGPAGLPAIIEPPAASRSRTVTREAEPIRIFERDARANHELQELVGALYDCYKSDGCVSRGTRRIAPNLFIGSARRGYFNYGRSNDIILVYGYTGPEDGLAVLLEEMYRYCETRNFQMNVLAGEEAPETIAGVPFSATPFGVMQRIGHLKQFSLDGGAMRRLRYQVSKFQKSGRCRTEEYRCGSNEETARDIARVIDRWCQSRTMVNPLVHDVKAEILAGTLPPEHRIFLTWLDDVLQNAIVITALSPEQNGYLMDMEFYLPDMPLGGLEFAIAQIIEVLVAEGCDLLSLGGTYGCKIQPSPRADPEIDRILDGLREQDIFNDQGNLQFKNKFRPETSSIHLCRPVGSGNADNVLDIIMMIADPERMQTSDAENHNFGGALRDLPVAVQEPPARTPPPSAPAGPERVVLEDDERSRTLAQYGFNPLNIPSARVAFDLKTDSWAQLEMPAIQSQMRHLRGQLQQPGTLDDSLRAVFPFAHFVLTPSGQMAEHLFFKAWPKQGLVLQNLLFPSTIFHQIDKGFSPMELPHAEVFQLSSEEPYRGNMAWDALQAKVAQDPPAIACVCIEVGNNAAGGAPVSMQHLRDVKTLLAAYSIPLVMDGTRVMENAQFLIDREQEYAGKSMWAVAREILSFADAVIGSLTKDFCVDRGGIIATNDAGLFQRLQELLDEESAGIDGIDTKLIARALQNRRQIEARVLRRMEHVRLIGRALSEHGIPVARPIGGHCVLIEVKRIAEFRELPDPVASFLSWLYVSTGIRAGAHSVGMQKRTRINDLVRLAIPVGLKRDEIDSVIERILLAFDKKVDIPEIVLESSVPQPFGVHSHYRLVKVHSPSESIPAGADPAGAAQAPSPAGMVPPQMVSCEAEKATVAPNGRNRRTQDVAIVGMAGRYPKAKNSRELWENLARGRDCVEEIPADRYERRLQHGSADRYRGGFIDDVDRFDSLFFNISPREAEILDPQERLVLEVAWEAIEDAGYYPEILAREDGSRNVGVFVGAVWAMYQILGVEETHAGNEVAPNSFLWSIANRVSYCLNLSGPSLTVDTACSSSLTALYLACEAIQAGDCSAAIVGGVNLDLHQAKLDINSYGNALSVDGVCRSFGKGANGYVAGEGIGALFLKPLDQAEHDRDHVYGVIKSAVVNHGGRTAGYTVPNPTSQSNLILAAIEKANIGARSIGYIEAHGTGTELGDPIEITGLTTAFSADHVEHQTCAIGSVKSNIGHLEAAAGVAGVAKVLLQMQHRQLVPSLHSSQLNEFIDFEHSPFYVVQNLEEWKAKEVDGVRLPLRAGVSSFGAGGANAHIILESYEPVRQVQEEPAPPAELIFPLSAQSEGQLREAALRLLTFLRENQVDLNDAAYTLQQGRKSFEHRLAVVARTKDELIARLAGFLDGKKSEDTAAGHGKGSEGVTRLLNRREKQAVVQLLSQSRDSRRIAGLWAEGLLTDWQGFQSFSSGKRTSLPTYPFADRRHWIADPSAVRRVALQPAAGVHPMIDSNESTFERQLFKKTFHERDFFIYDHHVSGVPTLPGVAYLEFARKAGEIAAGRPVRRIQNILWLSPIAVESSTPKEVFIELKPSGEAVRFEVFSETAQGVRTLHSQGKLLYTSRHEAGVEPDSVDLDAVRARCGKAMDGKSAYPLFKSVGLTLGPSFQVLQEVYRSDSEVLGVLRLPELRQGDLQSMVLHPSLVDGSLQAAMAARLGDQSGEMLVPYSIGEVEIVHPLQPDCFSYTTEAKGKEGSRVLKSNVLILDRTGKVLARIRESTGVPLADIHQKPEKDADGFSRLYYAYEWEKAPLAAQDGTPAGPQSMLLFAPDETLRDLHRERLTRAGAQSARVILVRPGDRFRELDGDSYEIDPRSREDFTRLFEVLAERNAPFENICFAWTAERSDFRDQNLLTQSLERGITSFLYLCQALINRKLENKVQLLYVHSGRAGEGQPHNEAVTGFVNTLRLEQPKLLCKTLEVRPGEGAWAEVLDAVRAEFHARVQDANAVRYEAQERSVRKFKPVDLHEAAGSSASPGVRSREMGVYLITGGAGGLGLIFAEHLARECKARLVLTGRSKLSAEGETRLEGLRESGAEVLYLPADVSRRDDVTNVVNECRSRFGEINGIIHSAGVLRDSYVRNKTAEEMRAVFAAKVFGTLHLDQATKDEALDFFVTFSSLAAVAGNVGQSDYSFANHFMDSFAAERERLRAEGARAGQTLSINWSLWADGGMRPDEQTELYLRKTLGMKPLSTATGVDAFVRGLATGRSQLAVIEGDREKWELAWSGKKKEPAPAAPVPPASASPAATAPVAVENEGDLVSRVEKDLTQIVMELLKLEAGDVASDKILLDLGFDSIGLATYANAVNDRYQTDITPVLFFDSPSVGEIAKHLCAECGEEIRRFYRGAAPAAAAVAPLSAAQVVAAAPAGQREPVFEISKRWDPAALDGEVLPSASGGAPAPELRFAHQPIAIVGMSGVMPQSDDLDEFWENLRSSKDLVTLVPPDRWSWEEYFGDPLKEPNKTYAKWGGFMREVDKFDPLFFGISPREAQMMDPQQRIFLEQVWKAIEDSGQKVSDLAGTRTGLFVGAGTTDYSLLVGENGIPLDGYTASGNSHAMTANRVSFLLNLRGPSAPIDTACSSSLIALHRAVESIHGGNCDMAIVGGVQAMLSPAAFITFSAAGMLSPEGKCKTFDKSANGYVRGEGAGAIFLKPLDMAVADGNHIYAVIKGAAENHGGKVTTMTAPNTAAQAELLIEAYEKAHVDPATVGYIECHGTGTALGDPIEIQALTRAFTELYKKHGKAAGSAHCGLSSVKTNIGHLETGAGIAGVLKVLLAIKHKQIPANLHLEEVNPYINLKGTPFYIVDELTEWKAPLGEDGAPLPRRAGVSSFGFGGANAHVVLEEYIPAARAVPAEAREPQLIVLSAKNEARLEAYVRSLLAYVGEHDVELIDLAYTLQVGRNEMPARLALVASDIHDLKQKLAAILQGAEATDSYRNVIRKPQADGGAGDTAVQGLAERRELSKLAELWASGAKIDWRLLYVASLPRRISAPTYPFARERYWITDGAQPVARNQGGIGAAQLHPLVHRNVSTLKEQKFASRFTGAEFYLADHRMGADAVLPGVAYMELVAAAGELAGERKVRFIRDMSWLAPIVVGNDGREVEVSLSPGRNEVEFAVRTVADGNSVLHCRGKLAYLGTVSEPAALDVAAIRERCSDETIAGTDLYPFLCTSGLSLGKGFEVVQRVHAGRSESLAVLQLPEHLKGEADRYWLHPALLDGAVHTAIGLVKRRKPHIPWSVPSSVREVQIFGSLKDVHYAHAVWDLESVKDEKSLITLQLHLLDRNGMVLVRMMDFVAKPFVRVATQTAASHGTAALQTLLPVWNAVPLETGKATVPPEPDRIVLLGGDPTQLDWIRASYPGARRLELVSSAGIEAVEQTLRDCSFDQLLWVAPDASSGSDSGDYGRLIEEQEEGVLAVFRIVKALLRLGYASRKLQWTLITSRTQRVTAGDPIQPAHAGVIGLVGSLAKEYPHWDLRLLDVDSLGSLSAAECLSLPWDKHGNALAHRRNEWLQQGLGLVQSLPPAASLYRQNGVYVVIGGAGGVGEVWSRFMIEQYQANVIWIGRRECDPSIQEKIHSLSRLGPAPLYISADATDAAALEQARSRILETYPAIHAVVHSAIVLQDQSILRMEEPVFRASLSAKVDVSVNMERVFGREELDFMLFFSSIVSFVKSPGQSNYAAGCTFKDSFAHQLQQRRPYPVKIMNWGYWGSVGVVADDSHKRMMAQMGIGSIEPDEGMASLQVLVGSALGQMILMKTLDSQAATGLDPAEALTYTPATAPAILPQVQGVLSERASAMPIAALEAGMPAQELADFLTEALASTLLSLGLFRNGIAGIADLSLGKRPAPYYEQWLSSSIRYLQQQNVLAGDLTLSRTVRPLVDLWAEWEAKRAVWAGAPNQQAQIALLEACLKGLPEVLTAKQLATDVLFPNSSMHLVEGVYRGNALVDHFNDVLGQTLSACMEQQLRADPQREIRILEIGAGTGGTTAKLLPALQRLPVAEYCYTDISRAFLMYAEKNFKSALPALTTAIFDVTKPLAGQPIRAAHYDFVIAANVLHATPDIRETLRNAKAALKNQGVLLLNEIAMWSLFNHLTFGLLEGWWLPEDAPVRLQGSPGLAPEKWREILAEEGFEPILFPAEPTHRFGQQIVAAASNGWTRQRIVKQTTPPPSAVDVAATKPVRTAAHVPAAAPDRQRSLDHVRRVIVETLSGSLRLDTALIRNEAPFAEYGLDSIIGVNFVRTVSEALQIELETTSLFEYSTVDDLAQYIENKWRDQIAAQLGSAEGGARTVSSSADEAPAEADPHPVRRFVTEEQLPEAPAPESDTRGGGFEPIAIIGMSGRFAESESLDAFWQNLAEGKDLVRTVSRWSTTDCVVSPDAGHGYCSHASAIDSFDLFDPKFFGIPAEEATYMDPQQRLFLEESWRALEDAGYAGKGVHEKQCGVYVGCGTSNYNDLFTETPPAQAWWGNSQSIVPARIAYHLNLQGPAVAVDSACSSALVGIHLACQGLWSGETEMALAGGVWIQATPAFHHVANRAGMLSPDGKCYSFDARGIGFAPGEAVGVVVLKRLRDALQDGDHIHGVIAGSAINQDGKSNGLIAPNGRAQERLQRSLYERFKINPETIQVVEAHATGTLLGDSIEHGAITRSFREYTDEKQFCAIGSVKTNIGHAGNAAAIAGVLKLLLSLKHRQIPPSLHFEHANPAIDFESSPFYVNTQLSEWRVKGNEKRRGAVSSFGFSGTNAHLVIEEAPPRERVTAPSPAYLILLSARTAEQLKQQARNLLALVESTPDLSMNDLSFSLVVGRMHLSHRLSCVARSQAELIHLLEQWMETGEAPQVFTAEIREGRVREQAALKRLGNYCIQECRETTDAARYLENLAAIADLHVQGYSLDVPSLFPRGSRRMPLPTYPFARERYWVGGGPAAATAPRAAAAASARLHPLLHANTSTLGRQSYSLLLTGTEFFVRDHQVAMNGHGGQTALPGAAYLEMARAAMENAARIREGSAIVELEDTVWGSPMIVSGNTDVTISLFAGNDGQVRYEIDSTEGGQTAIHCQGRAVFSDQPSPGQVDLRELQARMRQGTPDPEGVYAQFAAMGIHYGPAHRVITAIHQGDRQLLARLSLPTAAALNEDDDHDGRFFLHPSLMTGALQAGLRLVCDGTERRGSPLLPHGLERLRVLARSTGEMFAWAHHAQGALPEDTRIDVDLIDGAGNVCAQMLGLSFEAYDAIPHPQARAVWLFSREAPDAAGISRHNGSMGAVEKIELFLRQETALQLNQPIEDIPTDQSYFDLGLTSLAMAHFIKSMNRLFDEELSPSALFEYTDIQSLAVYLAETYPDRIDAWTVVRRADGPSQSVGQPGPAKLPPLSVATPSAVHIDREQMLAQLLWEEASRDDAYEKVTF
jgi:polyketide synthase PksN